MDGEGRTSTEGLLDPKDELEVASLDGFHSKDMKRGQHVWLDSEATSCGTQGELPRNLGMADSSLL